MGGNTSQEVTIATDSQEQDQKQFQSMLDEQLSGLREEVKTIEPLIQEGIKDTTHTIQDAVIMRYSQLQDKKKIEENIKAVFGRSAHPMVEAATSLVCTLATTAEMHGVSRWYDRKCTKRIGRHVVGIEFHYKLQVIEKDTGVLRRSKDTICLIAYKFLVHMLDKNPEDYLDDGEEKYLTF